MTDETETGAARRGVGGRDMLLRDLILETAGVDLLVGAGRCRPRARHPARRRALLQYMVLLAGRGEM